MSGGRQFFVSAEAFQSSYRYEHIRRKQGWTSPRSNQNIPGRPTIGTTQPKNPRSVDPKFAKFGNTVANWPVGKPNHCAKVAAY